MDVTQIGSTVEPRTVTDYDITFTNGLIMSLTLDDSLGDRLEQKGNTLVVMTVARPSPLDPKVQLPAENTMINLNNVLAIQSRSRDVTDPTPEQQAAWEKILSEMSGQAN